MSEIHHIPEKQLQPLGGQHFQDLAQDLYTRSSSGTSQMSDIERYDSFFSHLQSELPKFADKTSGTVTVDSLTAFDKNVKGDDPSLPYAMWLTSHFIEINQLKKDFPHLTSDSQSLVGSVSLNDIRLLSDIASNRPNDYIAREFQYWRNESAQERKSSYIDFLLTGTAMVVGGWEASILCGAFGAIHQGQARSYSNAKRESPKNISHLFAKHRDEARASVLY